MKVLSSCAGSSRFSHRVSYLSFSCGKWAGDAANHLPIQYKLREAKYLPSAS